MMLLNICYLNAQNNYSRSYNTLSGLPHDYIYSIAQDHNGFLWIGTRDGLSRFDGNEFKNYYHNPSDSTTIPYFTVYKVLVDYSNRVWVLAGKYLSLYDPSNDHFISNFRFDKSSWIVSPVKDVALNPSNQLFVLMENGILQYDYLTNQFIKVELYNPVDNSQIVPGAKFLGFDLKGNLWGQSNHQNYIDLSARLCYYDFLKKKKIIQEYHQFIYDFESYSDFTPPNDILAIHQIEIDIDGLVWLFTNQGLLKCNPVTGICDRAADIFPSNIKGSQPYYYWGSDNHGIYVYNSTSDEMTNINPELERFNTSIFIDRNNTIWHSGLSMTGNGDGLNQYINTPKTFRHLLNDQNVSGNPILVFAIHKDHEDNIWIGCKNYNYLLRIDPSGKVEEVNKLSQDKWLKSMSPRSIVEDSGSIWFGYFSHLLMRYDKSNGKFETVIYQDKSDDINSQALYFRTINADTKGNIFSFTGDAIFRYNVNNRELVKVYSQNKIDEDNVQTYVVKVDKSGNYWLGGNYSRIICLDKNFNIKEIQYLTTQQRYNIEDLCFGDDNELWAATMGGGICRLDLKTKQWLYLTTANGLSNNVTYSILKDKKGRLWVSTDDGICRIDPVTYQIKKFGKQDGLNIKEFNADAAFLAEDGEMYFGGVGGLVHFYPDSIEMISTKAIASPMRITSFKVAGKEQYFEKPVYETAYIRLRKGEDNFQVSFACLDFINAEKINYRYFLNGHDDQWVTTDHRHRFVNYANLAPGKYTLEIQATDNEGQWSLTTSLEIVIPPTFIQTVWFKLGILILVVLLVLLFIYYNNRQIRLKEKEKQDELKLESLRGQMNPHFIFNSLNSINYFISQNDRLSANRYIADFSRLIRSILNNLSSEYVSLEKELESLNDYLNLEHLRFGNKFEYKLVVDETIDPVILEVFPGLVQPFIENAIWHGLRGLEERKGLLSILFVYSESKVLVCQITDDGIGQKLAAKLKSQLPGRKSRGIGIVQERLDIINKIRKTNYSFIIEDFYPQKEETGTKVTIQIPSKLVS